MGFLGLFDKKGPGALKKHATRVANKRAQAPDRWDSIHSLATMKTEEAAGALLQRFTFRVDPSITDQEEKEAAVGGVVAAGEAAVGPLRTFLRRNESIAWPLKCLERLLSPEEVTGELIALLEEMDTEYERDPEKKILVLSMLEERRDPRIAGAVHRFLEDANETARFHAAATLLAHTSEDDTEAVRAPLLDLLSREDSVRVRSSVLDGFIERGWDLGEQASELRSKLPPGYAIDSKGRPRKS